jgi:5-formyltetrahydrofolate cyclo-ligase
MEHPAPHADKAGWRRWARATRARLSSPARSSAVVAGIRAEACYRRAGDVLLYLPFGSEVDPTALLSDDKRFHLTRTWPGSRNLTLHPYDPEALETHPLGYRQPRADAQGTDPAAIDLVLVPGLVFDRRGGRLGYGGGYYDRLLPTLPADTPRVGVTLYALVVPALPSEAYDVAMTHLATERGLRPLPDEAAPH